MNSAGHSRPFCPDQARLPVLQVIFGMTSIPALVRSLIGTGAGVGGFERAALLLLLAQLKFLLFPEKLLLTEEFLLLLAAQLLLLPLLMP